MSIFAVVRASLANAISRAILRRSELLTSRKYEMIKLSGMEREMTELR